MKLKAVQFKQAGFAHIVLLIILLVIGLGIAGYFFVFNNSVKAIYITDNNPEGVGVVWQTKSAASSFLAPDQGWQTQQSIFFNKNLPKISDVMGFGNTHMSKLKNLKAGQTYAFRIIVNGVVRDRVVVKTTPALGNIPSPQPMLAQALGKDSNPLLNSLIIIQLASKTDQAKYSTMLATKTNNEGKFSIDLSNIRDKDLKNSYKYNNQTDKIKIFSLTNAGVVAISLSLDDALNVHKFQFTQDRQLTWNLISQVKAEEVCHDVETTKQVCNQVCRSCGGDHKDDAGCDGDENHPDICDGPEQCHEEQETHQECQEKPEPVTPPEHDGTPPVPVPEGHPIDGGSQEGGGDYDPPVPETPSQPNEPAPGSETTPPAETIPKGSSGIETVNPFPVPAVEPIATPQPTPKPTVQSTPEPTSQSTPEPTVQPTPEPISVPSAADQAPTGSAGLSGSLSVQPLVTVKIPPPPASTVQQVTNTFGQAVKSSVNAIIDIPRCSVEAAKGLFAFFSNRDPIQIIGNYQQVAGPCGATRGINSSSASRVLGVSSDSVAQSSAGEKLTVALPEGEFSLVTEINGKKVVVAKGRVEAGKVYKITPNLEGKEGEIKLAGGRIKLEEGWNLVALNVTPKKDYLAEDMLNEINAEGGQAVAVNRWIDNKWQTHEVGNFGTNFKIEVGHGYFVYVKKVSTWLVPAENDVVKPDVLVDPGWNLLATTNLSIAKASELLNHINTNSQPSVNADTVTQYVNNLWQSIKLKDNTVFGKDFEVTNRRSYFIKAQNQGVWKSR